MKRLVELPQQWVEVRDRLLRIDQRYLDYDRFVALCESVGLPSNEARSLVDFLHETGVIFYQPGAFGERLILDQRWAIEAVYSLFDRRGGAYAELTLAARIGLTLDTLKRKVWRHFSVDEHQLLLEFMKSCEICFEFSKGVYYAPQLLPEEAPQRVRLRWTELSERCMRIDYAFLHRMIIDRFIVRAGLLGADTEPEIWRNGIVIYHPRSKTEALIHAYPDRGCIEVSTRGDSAVDLINMVRTELEQLHRDFPGTVSVSADGGEHFVQLETLRQYGLQQPTKYSDYR